MALASGYLLRGVVPGEEKGSREVRIEVKVAGDCTHATTPPIAPHPCVSGPIAPAPVVPHPLPRTHVSPDPLPPHP
jgi:hypothetical protein